MNAFVNVSGLTMLRLAQRERERERRTKQISIGLPRNGVNAVDAIVATF